MSQPITYPFRGQMLTVREIAAAAGLKPTGRNLTRLRERIARRGWDAERAVTEPAMSASACGRIAARKLECQIPRGN